jgi:arylsulfatase A-like enzyme
VAPDSYSFLPSLLNKANPHPRTYMVTADANGIHALRDGEWKYIDDTPPDRLPDNRLKQLAGFEPQLYNLANDPGEMTNLYNEYPELVKKLLEKLNGIRKAEFAR